jgi:hypothetical protein
MNGIMLTVAQAEVIYELANDGYSDGVPFLPLDAFPERNNKHNSCRRVLRALAKKEIIETSLQPDNHNPAKLVEKFVLGEKAIRAFHEWAAKRDYDFSCFGD